MPPTDIEPSESRLEQLAARCVPGSGPLQIHPLGSGLVNRSYRVGRDGRLFSLRVAAPRAAQLGLDRNWECRVLRCAADAGLAPAVEHCAPRARIVVTRWVEGESWSVEQAAQSAIIARVAALARRVHALPLLDKARVASPLQWIAFYRARLERRRGQSSQHPGPARSRPELDRQAQALLDALGGEPAAAPVLCHSDLHVQNVLVDSGGALLILDWEYAHVSEALWDLAGWAANGDLTAECRNRLLRCYLTREPSAAEAARLSRLAWLYDYVCVLWSELYLSSRPDDEPGRADVSARALRLVERLRCAPQAGGSGCAGEVPAH